MNAIEIHDLSKSYADFQLDHINLVLPGGCIMGLIGENGAGKTTTIKLILDMIHRDSGTIIILGKDNQTDIRQIKDEIGVVFDEASFPEELTASQIGKFMKYTYSHWDEHFFHKMLKKLSIPEKKSFQKFSKGMKMKLAIAVALSHDPKLLILDEPTSGLDPVVRDEIVDMFNEFTRDETHSILISSHIVSDLEKICDYIAFLHNGKLLLCEEKDRLLEQYGLIHCSPSQLAELNPSAIKGKKASAYGVEAVVDRNKMPSDTEIRPVTIEELFISMVKGDKGI